MPAPSPRVRSPKRKKGASRRDSVHFNNNTMTTKPTKKERKPKKREQQIWEIPANLEVQEATETDMTEDSDCCDASSVMSGVTFMSDMTDSIIFEDNDRTQQAQKRWLPPDAPNDVSPQMSAVIRRAMDTHKQKKEERRKQLKEEDDRQPICRWSSGASGQLSSPRRQSRKTVNGNGSIAPVVMKREEVPAKMELSCSSSSSSSSSESQDEGVDHDQRRKQHEEMMDFAKECREQRLQLEQEEQEEEQNKSNIPSSASTLQHVPIEKRRALRQERLQKAKERIAVSQQDELSANSDLTPSRTGSTKEGPQDHPLHESSGKEEVASEKDSSASGGKRDHKTKNKKRRSSKTAPDKKASVPSPPVERKTSMMSAKSDNGSIATETSVSTSRRRMQSRSRKMSMEMGIPIVIVDDEDDDDDDSYDDAPRGNAVDGDESMHQSHHRRNSGFFAQPTLEDCSEHETCPHSVATKLVKENRKLERLQGKLMEDAIDRIRRSYVAQKKLEKARRKSSI